MLCEWDELLSMPETPVSIPSNKSWVRQRDLKQAIRSFGCHWMSPAWANRALPSLAVNCAHISIHLGSLPDCAADNTSTRLCFSNGHTDRDKRIQKPRFGDSINIISLVSSNRAVV